MGEALGDIGQVLFAVKSFPSAEVLAALAAVGAGFEVSSVSEYDLLPSDLAGRRVSLNAPEPSDLDSLIKKGNLLDVHVDVPSRVNELEIPDSGRFVLRLSHTGLGLPSALVGDPMRDSRFGSSLQALDEFAKLVDSQQDLAVHLHNGSENNSSDFYHAALSQILGAANRTGAELSSINLGGGFHQIETRDLRETLAALSSDAGESTVLIEPGNVSARGSGFLLTRAVSVRSNASGLHHVTLDCSYESHAKWSLPIWEPTAGVDALRCPHNVIPEAEDGCEFVLFYGSSCYEKDLMGVYRVPATGSAPITRGDYLRFANLNGYSFAWNIGFNGVPPAEVVLV